MKDYVSRFFSDANFRKKAIRWIFRGKFVHLFHSYSNNLIIHFINLWASHKVICSVCEWEGARFESIATMEYYRPSAKCPGCGSLERHRALFNILKKRDILSLGLTYLDIAPVPGITDLLKQRVQYISIDYGALSADVRGDVQYLPFIQGAFNVIVCFHVMEFVKDWRKALHEFQDSLKVGGVLIISENFMCRQSSTIEFDIQTLFDGSPHRRFGEDFPETLKNMGFHVQRVDYLGYNDERGDYIFICSIPKEQS